MACTETASGLLQAGFANVRHARKQQADCFRLAAPTYGLHGNNKRIASGWLRQRMAFTGTASGFLQVGCANVWLAREQQADCFRLAAPTFAMTGRRKKKGGGGQGRRSLPWPPPPPMIKAAPSLRDPRSGAKQPLCYSPCPVIARPAQRGEATSLLFSPPRHCETRAAGRSNLFANLPAPSLRDPRSGAKQPRC